jgi:two-component system, chemotaxis family, chemotaxis protein CheY
MRNAGESQLKSILCVGEDRDAAFLLRQVCAGYRVVRAHNAYEAVCAAHRQHVDLFFLDGPLSDWSTAALCRVIRKFDQQTPVVISADASDSERADFLESGAQALLPRPLEPARLVECLAKILAPADSGVLPVQFRPARVRASKHELLLEALARVEFRGRGQPGSWWRSTELLSLE